MMYPWHVSLPRGRKCEKKPSAAGEQRAKKKNIIFYIYIYIYWGILRPCVFFAITPAFCVRYKSSSSRKETPRKKKGCSSRKGTPRKKKGAHLTAACVRGRRVVLRVGSDQVDLARPVRVSNTSRPEPIRPASFSNTA